MSCDYRDPHPAIPAHPGTPATPGIPPTLGIPAQSGIQPYFKFYKQQTGTVLEIELSLKQILIVRSFRINTHGDGTATAEWVYISPKGSKGSSEKVFFYETASSSGRSHEFHNDSLYLPLIGNFRKEDYTNEATDFEIGKFEIGFKLSPTLTNQMVFGEIAGTIITLP